VKIQKGGKNATIAVEELDLLVRHVLEFQKVVSALERQDAAGKLAPELQRPWKALKKFMEAEEAKASGGEKAARARRVRCCILRNPPLTNVVKCEETNTSLVLAAASCIAQAILGGFDATIVPGTCKGLTGCP